MLSKSLATSRKPVPVNLFAETPGYSFNEAGQLQGHAVPGSETKLLVSHQSVLAYYM